MEPLRIGHHVIQVEHPHILLARGLLGTYNDVPIERWALDFAYLGYCIRGEHKPPHRTNVEPYALYGQRVYDHLVALGGEHWKLEEYADALVAEAFKRLPPRVTKQEVDEAGKPSTQTTESSSTGSDSLCGTPETP